MLLKHGLAGLTHAAAGVTWAYTDSLSPTLFSDAAWGTQTLTSGWWVNAPVVARADSNDGDMAQLGSTGTVTVVVDVRPTGSAETVNLEINNVGVRAGTPTMNSVTGVATTNASVTVTDTVDINGDGTVWRWYAQMTVDGSTRFFVDIPNSPMARTDLQRPAIFDGALTATDVENLV